MKKLFMGFFICIAFVSFIFNAQPVFAQDDTPDNNPGEYEADPDLPDDNLDDFDGNPVAPDPDAGDYDYGITENDANDTADDDLLDDTPVDNDELFTNLLYALGGIVIGALAAYFLGQNREE